MSDVRTRADDRWARLALLLWSQREEDWREPVKSGKMVSTIEPSTCSHSTSARQKGANQYARWENCTKCQQRLSTEKRDYWKEAKVLHEKALEKEEMAKGNGGTEEQSFPIRSKTASATSQRSTEQDRVRTWTGITNSHGGSKQQYQRSPRGSAQGTGTASRVLATHVGAAITDAASSSNSRCVL